MVKEFAVNTQLYNFGGAQTLSDSMDRVRCSCTVPAVFLVRDYLHILEFLLGITLNFTFHSHLMSNLMM